MSIVEVRTATKQELEKALAAIDNRRKAVEEHISKLRADEQRALEAGDPQAITLRDSISREKTELEKLQVMENPIKKQLEIYQANLSQIPGLQKSIENLWNNKAPKLTRALIKTLSTGTRLLREIDGLNNDLSNLGAGVRIGEKIYYPQVTVPIVLRQFLTDYPLQREIQKVQEAEPYYFQPRKTKTKRRRKEVK